MTCTLDTFEVKQLTNCDRSVTVHIPTREKTVRHYRLMLRIIGVFVQFRKCILRKYLANFFFCEATNLRIKYLLTTFTARNDKIPAVGLKEIYKKIMSLQMFSHDFTNTLYPPTMTSPLSNTAENAKTIS